jgi:hypothetical protein
MRGENSTSPRGRGEAAKQLGGYSPLPCLPPLPLECSEESLTREARACKHLAKSQLRRLRHPRDDVGIRESHDMAG